MVPALRARDTLRRVFWHLHEFTPTIYDCAAFSPSVSRPPSSFADPQGVMAGGLPLLKDPSVGDFSCPLPSRCFLSFVLEISYRIYYAMSEHLDSQFLRRNYCIPTPVVPDIDDGAGSAYACASPSLCLPGPQAPPPRSGRPRSRTRAISCKIRLRSDSDRKYGIFQTGSVHIVARRR